MAESTGKMLLRLAPMTYGPNILFGLGEGALLPVIPVIAASLGADIATAGLIASMLVVGRLIGNLPAGWLVSRFGERITMFVAALVGIVAIITLALSSTLGVFTACILVIGLCDAAFSLARHAFMTTRVPLYFRARALSLLGGSYRFGVFVGPFIAAALIALTGGERSIAWFFTVCFALIALLVILGPDPEKTFQAQEVSVSGSAHLAAVPEKAPGVLRTMVIYRGVLARMGLAAAALSALRAARQVILPLWGVSIGIDAQSIALIMGISGAIDFGLFYVSGQIIDRFGRLWAALPSILLMGLGFVALSFTHDLEGSVVWFAVLSAVIAVGNGFSSGILMTLGADLAPARNPAPFLGSWRTLSDAGGALAPLAFSAITAALAIGVATGLMGVIGILGAIGFARWVPRYVPKPQKNATGDSPEPE